jgi:hypothetical protein
MLQLYRNKVAIAPLNLQKTSHTTAIPTQTSDAIGRSLNGIEAAVCYKRGDPKFGTCIMSYENTFGWTGCDNGKPWVGDKVCITSGKPPLPDVNPQAQCGLTSLVNGKRNVTCPLNICC